MSDEMGKVELQTALGTVYAELLFNPCLDSKDDPYFYVWLVGPRDPDEETGRRHLPAELFYRGVRLTLHGSIAFTDKLHMRELPWGWNKSDLWVNNPGRDWQDSPTHHQKEVVTAAFEKAVQDHFGTDPSDPRWRAAEALAYREAAQKRRSEAETLGEHHRAV